MRVYSGTYFREYVLLAQPQPFDRKVTQHVCVAAAAATGGGGGSGVLFEFDIARVGSAVQLHQYSRVVKTRYCHYLNTQR